MHAPFVSPMSRNHLKILSLCSLAVLFAFGLLGYSAFTSGGLPGIYPLAALYSRLFSPLVSLMMLLSFQWWVLLPVIGFFIGLFALYTRRRHLRTAFFALLVWPVLIVLLLPAMVGLSSGQQLAVEPWGRVYRTAYSSLWIDDNYGDVLLFGCDLTGTFCKRLHKHYSVSGAENNIPMAYDAENDQLKLGGDGQLLYVRSQTEVICNASESDSKLVSPPPGSSASPTKPPAPCSTAS